MKFLAELAPSADSHQKKGNPIGPFLEMHVLGLVARVSEIVNDSRDEHSMKQKERYLKAMEELVKVAKSHARVARPQVCPIDQACHHQMLTCVRYARAYSPHLTRKSFSRLPSPPGPRC